MAVNQHGYYMCNNNLRMANPGRVLLVPLLGCAAILPQLLLPLSEIFIITPSAKATAGVAAPHPRLSK